MSQIPLLPKQLEFVHANQREVLYSGAVRAGKSKALAVKVALRASVKGAREMLWRKYLADLKQTTLKTLLEGDGSEPPVLPTGFYTHNKADKTIRINGGGEIVYGGMVSGEGKDQRVGSYSATGVNIDEATEFAEHEYRMLASRASVPVAGLVNQINMVSNPGPPSHWIARMFGLAPDAPACPPNRLVIRTRSHDNFFLPDDYLKFLDTMTGLWKKRMVDGLWVGSDGLVYDHWLRETHVRTVDTRGFKRWVLGVDDGYTNPFVSLRIAVDGDGRIHVEREFYEPGKLLEGKVAAVREMSRGCEAVLVDPSAADLIGEFHKREIPAVAANNEVFDGITRVQQRLAIAGDGRPRLTVDPSCKNLITEFETYEWKPNRNGSLQDDPIKESDHALDGLRYAVTYLDQGGVTSIASGVQGRKKPEEYGSVRAAFEAKRRDVNFGF